MEEVKKLTLTCEACPSQWEGETVSGKKIYIRYRHGILRYELDGEIRYGIDHGHIYDGFMTDEEMIKLLEMQSELGASAGLRFPAGLVIARGDPDWISFLLTR